MGDSRPKTPCRLETNTVQRTYKFIGMAKTGKVARIVLPSLADSIELKTKGTLINRASSRSTARLLGPKRTPHIVISHTPLPRAPAQICAGGGGIRPPAERP